jgi:signal transduction histidine kinase/CheY-like chemotaxis protein
MELDPDLLERVIIVAPVGRDSSLVQSVLGEASIHAVAAESVEQACDELDRGCGALLITEESLTPHATVRLAECLQAQPLWSDLPLLVLCGMTELQQKPRSFRELGARANVTLVDRPLRIKSLVTAVESALRARRRQYEVHTLMEQLGERIEERDRFLAILGHELRNPLAAILMAAESANDNGGGLDPANVQLIQRQTRHLTRLVDDLLNLTRLTSGRIVLQKELVDLAALITECERNFEEQAASQKVTLEVKQSEEQLLIEGDVVRLEQIINNLVTNALKYTPAGGKVTIESLVEGDSVLLRVRDSGIGIPPDQLEQIFGLFTQATNIGRRGTEGLGIGLSLVQRLTKLHGGTILARSDGVGRGSEFELRLPVAQGVESLGSSPAAAAGPLLPGSLKIVLVDDNHDLRTLLERSLSRLGHEVSSAATGEEGVDLILAGKPDLGIIDIRMPGIDGYEVARRVRKEREGEGLFLVALSGFGQPEDKERARQAGFDDHLTKPVDRAELQALLQRVLAGRVEPTGVESGAQPRQAS